MKTITCAAVAALLLGAAACNQAPAAQAGPAIATFTARPNLSADVEALPRLVGEGAAVTAINADLDRRDTAAKADGCEGGGGHSRSISQPMTGPGFISFRIGEEYVCEGTAHPSLDKTFVTYNLATGQAVDWVSAAPGLQLTRGDTTDLPAAYEPGLSSAALAAWYSAKALTSTDREQVEQCADVWSTESLAETSFKVWLDAEAGGLSVAPEFAHVVQACADTATLNAEDMRRFGVSPAMVDAVTAAHAAGGWAPKDE